MGYTQNGETWIGLSLGTLIMIQEEPIWRTRWGPCFGHKRNIFWQFLGKGDYGIHPTQECEIWYGASLGTLIMSQEEPIWGTMWGPCLGHNRIIFWLFLGKGARDYTYQLRFLNCHTHMLAYSTTPSKFYCENQGTAVDLWSCFHIWENYNQTCIFVIFHDIIWYIWTVADL